MLTKLMKALVRHTETGPKNFLRVFTNTDGSLLIKFHIF